MQADATQQGMIQVPMAAGIIVVVALGLLIGLGRVVVSVG